MCKSGKVAVERRLEGGDGGRVVQDHGEVRKHVNVVHKVQVEGQSVKVVQSVPGQATYTNHKILFYIAESFLIS